MQALFVKGKRLTFSNSAEAEYREYVQEMQKSNKGNLKWIAHGCNKQDGHYKQ